jgi:hypothetical protein
MGFQVVIDDNFHYQNSDHRYTLGECAHYADALAVCRRIVDRCLWAQYLPGMSASTLYFRYTLFGVDPSIVAQGGSEEPERAFFAWDYAKDECGRLCSAPSPAPPESWQRTRGGQPEPGRSPRCPPHPGR